MKQDFQTAFSPRQHMLSKDFELYYYNDTNLSNVENHTHNYYEFYFFLQGNISMYIDKKEYLLQPGDVILIPPNIRHHVVSHDTAIPYRRFVFWISKEYYKDVSKLFEDYKYIVSRAVQNKQYVYHNDTFNFNIIQSKLFRLVEEIHSDRFGKRPKIALGINDLILHLNIMAYEQTVPAKLHEKQQLYDKLLLYIETHLTEDLTLDYLANTFFVSKYHIAHIFKEKLGISVHQYITKKRLDMCCSALLSDDSISKTFLLYGFKDYSSFFRAFKKEYGLSPKEYKEIHKTKEVNS